MTRAVLETRCQLAWYTGAQQQALSLAVWVWQWSVQKAFFTCLKFWVATPRHHHPPIHTRVPGEQASPGARVKGLHRNFCFIPAFNPEELASPPPTPRIHFFGLKCKIYVLIYKTDNQQGPTVQHKELFSTFCSNL